MNKKVLIVDDCLDNSLMLQTILEIENFEVDTVDTALLGLTKIEKDLPDVVITNHMMPDMDGCEFLCRIRQSNFDQLPVLMVSGCDEYQVLANCSYQFNAFIQKPVDPDVLIQTIRLVLNMEDLY